MKKTNNDNVDADHRSNMIIKRGTMMMMKHGNGFGELKRGHKKELFLQDGCFSIEYLKDKLSFNIRNELATLFAKENLLPFKLKTILVY